MWQAPRRHRTTAAPPSAWQLMLSATHLVHDRAVILAICILVEGQLGQVLEQQGLATHRVPTPPWPSRYSARRWGSEGGEGGQGCGHSGTRESLEPTPVVLLQVRDDVDNVKDGPIICAHRVLKGREGDAAAVERQALEGQG